MLDGRIYRLSLIVPALALLVLAFSLSPEPRPLRASLPPTALTGSSIASTMDALQASDPDRSPGSSGDRAVAAKVAGALRGDGFAVSSDDFAARTVHGERALENVVATRAGSASGRGAIVVVAPRDVPGAAGASATAMLMALGRELGGQTLDRGVVLASVSGSVGAVGATRLAATLPRPVDAVIVLGDLASRPGAGSIIVPWSSGPTIAPARLRSTLAAALTGQSGIRAPGVRVLSQLAHLAFPFTISQQGPFDARSLPAVSLSLSGERGPRPSSPVLGPGRLAAVGQGVLAAVTALDSRAAIGAPSADVVFDGEIVPGWAISLFVLALFVPVALVTIDALARARRRRYPLGLALALVLSGAVPFLAAGIVLIIGHAFGALASPAGAVGPGAVALTGGAVATLAVALLVALGAGVLVRLAFTRLSFVPGGSSARRDAEPVARNGRGRTPAHPEDGAAPVALAVLCVVALALWVVNPLAAALLVPALHLWLWALDSELGLPAGGWVRSLMLALGALPTAAVAVFFSRLLGFDAGQLAYEAVLLLAGHVVSWVAAVEWSLALGCLVTGAVLVFAGARRPQDVVAPVTVRGPIGYAGPGSLGGTKSALRR